MNEAFCKACQKAFPETEAGPHYFYHGIEHILIRENGVRFSAFWQRWPRTAAGD